MNGWMVTLLGGCSFWLHGSRASDVMTSSRNILKMDPFKVQLVSTTTSPTMVDNWENTIPTACNMYTLVPDSAVQPTHQSTWEFEIIQMIGKKQTKKKPPQTASTRHNTARHDAKHNTTDRRQRQSPPTYRLTYQLTNLPTNLRDPRETDWGKSERGLDFLAAFSSRVHSGSFVCIVYIHKQILGRRRGRWTHSIGR
ncbi:hypothetical protein BD289DRAFT_15897 [Coniella lustricola]|uniref:Uncharacterized protein n=1 Tax=Coniella lustricola TaxID=2025994 RepID=A0A2T3A3U3_9PEZI|nr:hypothetical protein BD289DRAFT_15897 [Coniella lustricola]